MAYSITKAAGIDIGKESLEIALYPEGAGMQAANGPEGRRALVDWLQARGIERVALEASGGYERGVSEALRAAGLSVALLQPRQVRAYARYRLRWAKNDTLDAHLLARIGAELESVGASPDPRLASFSEHLRLIEQFEADLARMKTRLEAYREPRLRDKLSREIARLDQRKQAELALLRKQVRAHDDLKQRMALIESVAGVGARTALGLVILLPELGHCERGEIACLAGLAPFDHDSGRYAGQRRIAGGRARARSTLYMAAFSASRQWNPALIDLYNRLRDKGRSHKQAVIACARKLLIFINTVLARGTPWQKYPPQPHGC